MKKIKRIIKNNYKFLLGTVISFTIVTSVVKAADSISAQYVSYDNNSNITSTQVQGALDELWNAADVRSKSNFVSAYTYNESSCVTGKEKACVRTDCYKKGKTCPAGTIINYKVNDTDIVTFHVVSEWSSLSILKMQSQRNTIYRTKWYKEQDNSQGPLNVLAALESATAGWKNVLDLTSSSDSNGKIFYRISDNTSLGTSTGYTGYHTNAYTLSERTAKATMIAVGDADYLGCKDSMGEASCPKWMTNYLDYSTFYGNGTADDTIDNGNGNEGYWTMSASVISSNAWGIYQGGHLNDSPVVTNSSYGARAVVFVRKYVDDDDLIEEQHMN